MSYNVPNVEITNAPIKEPLVGDDNYPTKVWLQTLTDFADALVGDWGPLYTPSFTFNVTADGKTARGVMLGSCVNLCITLTNVSSGGTISISDALGFSAEETILDVYAFDGNNWLIQSGCYVKDKTITLPSVSASKVIIKGNLIRKV